MKLSKKTLSIIFAILISALAVFPAAAASKTIGSVELEVTSKIKAGESSGDVTVKTSTGNCKVSSTSVENKPSGKWEAGDAPKLKVTVATSSSSYKFDSSFSKGDVKLKGSSGKVTKVSRSNNNTKLTVYITLDSLTGGKDTGTSKARGSDKEADRDDDDDDDDDEEEAGETRKEDAGNNNGTSGNGKTVVKKNTLEQDKADKQPEGNNKTAETRQPEENNKTAETKQPEENKKTADARQSAGDGKQQGWQQDSRGWKWKGQDGGDVKNQWQKIDNKWYYFDDNGYMATGWKKLDDKWYYMDTNGDMVTGWKQIDGKWYYMDEDGAMLHDTTTPDGYRVGPDGAMVE